MNIESKSNMFEQGTIYCPLFGICQIKCNIDDGCNHAKVYGSYGSILNLTAVGRRSFQYGILYCPNNGICHIECEAIYSCLKTIIGTSIFITTINIMYYYVNCHIKMQEIHQKLK